MIFVSTTSLIVSLVALLISWVNARRTNASVLRVLEVRSYGQSSRPNLFRISRRLAVYLKKLGLPLHEPQLALILRWKDGSGTAKIELARYSIQTGEPIANCAQLAKGMVALFEVRSDSRNKQFLESVCSRLSDRSWLEIYDSGYLVQSFRVGGWRDYVGAKWNHIAWQINRRFDRRFKMADGSAAVKLGAIVPKLRNWQWGVDCFFKEIAADRQVGVTAESAAESDKENTSL